MPGKYFAEVLLNRFSQQFWFHFLPHDAEDRGGEKERRGPTDLQSTILWTAPCTKSKKSSSTTMTKMQDGSSKETRG
jgi:hypothetical protein